MAVEIPASPPSYEERLSSTFRPGDFSQDKYTLPIEVGLISVLSNFYTPRSKTLFPGFDQSTNESNNKTTYGRTMLLPYAIGTGLSLYNKDFSLWTEARGFAHALLLSEVAAMSAKHIFQEKRPNYNSQLSTHQGEEKSDSRASFYSDHASQAFAFTTYTSLLMFKYSNSMVVSCIYGSTSTVASSIISYSRVTDHAHHLSDVLVGAFMGSAISALTFFRVQEVQKQAHKPVNQTFVNWAITPEVRQESNGQTSYIANLNLEIK